MPLIMMALGRFRFGVDTAAYQQLQHSQSWRWKTQDRLGRKPAAQYLGPELAKVVLDGVIYPHFRGGLDQVSDMRALADQGEPLMWTDGRGHVHDLWCIVDVAETHSTFASAGVPKRITFSLTLQQYGEDAA